MQRAVIVHRWSGSPESDWYPWLRGELEAKGFTVLTPTIPDADNPTIDAWAKSLSDAVGETDDQLVLIGHSIGCQAVLRYLASINTPVAQAVLVAPWLHLTGLEGEEEQAVAKPWLETPIDFESVRAHCPKLSLIFSDDDPHVPLKENVRLFVGEFPLAAISVLPNHGHITEDNGITELPEALAAVV